MEENKLDNLEIIEEQFEENEDVSSKIVSGKIETDKVPISEIIKGYKDSEEEGTWSYSGKLNIRPAFQREFVYKNKEQSMVIDSILKGYPLSLIYWSVIGEDEFEMIDGQQRTLSIINFAQGKITVKIGKFEYDINNLDPILKDKFLKYELNIVKFTGTKSQKLEYFNLINTTQNKLYDQELLNAAYYGSFISDARKAFSNEKSEFFVEAGAGGNWTNYLIKPGTTVEINRQAILEKVLAWVAGGKNNIESYLIKHQSDENADLLIGEIKKILSWAKNTFSPSVENYHSFMGSLNWADAYYENEKLPYEQRLNETNVTKNIANITKLVEDDSVDNDEGIILYLITKDESHLNNRAFFPKEKKRKYKEQKGICPNCNEKFDLKDMAGDHIIPWSKGGVTEYSNLQMLCKPCNAAKSNITPIDDFKIKFN